jgi:carbon monoxide dehydrogenase subunit G
VEFEKTAVLQAPVERVWQTLLDPQVMGACVPGMESVEVVSDTEYLVSLHVKVSFVSARFKLRTTIVESRPPTYLRSEGTGEDSSLANSLKQSSEVFLTARGDGATELRMRLKIDVFGRLGGFGLNIIKTKADRMWEEFGRSLAARLQASPVHEQNP